jgi:hypothetical protein
VTSIRGNSAKRSYAHLPKPVAGLVGPMELRHAWVSIAPPSSLE